MLPLRKVRKWSPGSSRNANAALALADVEQRIDQTGEALADGDPGGWELVEFVRSDDAEARIVLHRVGVGVSGRSQLIG